MTFTTKALLLASAVSLAVPAFAAGTHPPVTGEPLADDQTFTYRVLDEHTSVDPQIVEDVSGSEIVRDLFEGGLYNQDADGNLEPGVALSHTVNDDNTVYTFTLRPPDAKWSDGKPVTAGDFVYAWRRLADPATASAYQWYVEVMNLKNAAGVMAGEMGLEELGVKAIDDHTLEVTLESPMPYFALTTTHTSTFPAPPAWAIEAHGSDWIKPANIVVNGAYTLTEHVPNERSVRERNAMYWNNDATIIDKVVALVINDENVALTRYLAGELDRTDIPTGQYPALSESHPDEATVFPPRLCSYYYTINMSDIGPEFLKDVRVRQALSLAVDRDIVVEKVLREGQFPAYTFTPPEATANFEVPAVEYAGMTQAERNARAVELLAEAGYDKSNPLELELMYNTDEGHKKVAIAIAQMWKQTLGVKVTLANQEWKTFLETRGNQDYQIARAGWCGDYNEASTFLDLVASGSGYNDAKYSNPPEVDALLTEAKSMADPQANYTKVEEIIAVDMPLIPIYHYTEGYMLASDLENWPIKNVEQNWYSRNLYKIAE